MDKIDICVDFDGTIVDHIYPDIGQAVPFALSTLRWLNGLDFINLILLTMRSVNSQYGTDTLTPAVIYCVENGVRFDYVNENPAKKHLGTSNKIYGKFYIDNNNCGCPLTKFDGFNRPCVDWSKILNILNDYFIDNGYIS